MINNFGMVGKSILARDGYVECQNKIKKRELFLLHHTLLPVEKKESIDRAIVLNFDLEKNEFRFELDKELDNTNRDYFFAFKVGASNDKKKFLSTNNIESFLNRLMTDSLFYLKDKRSHKKASQWFNENISLDYDQLLERLKSIFYKKEGDAYILDAEKMAAEYTEQYQRTQKELEESRKDKNKPVSPDKVYIRFLKEMFKQGKKVNLPSIFLVKINGEHIMELERYRDTYVNLVYYDLFERFFVEEVLKEKRCHICREKKDVIGKIPLSMKFYGTTNSLYFENVKNTNAYKSFALCKECLKDVLVGMKYTENHLSYYMFGLNCYLVPTLTEEDASFEKKLKCAANILKKRGTKYKDDIETVKKILKKSGSGDINKKFTFNLLFYFAEQQSFDILKYISDIELRQLIKKMELFDKYTEMYELESLRDFDKIGRAHV